MKNQIRLSILVILLMVTIIFVSFSVSYSYFKAASTGNVDETLSVTAGTMKLELADGDGTSVNATLNFGESKETYFTIENTGTLDAYAKICWKDLINTYQDGSLVYTLEYHPENDDIYIKVVDNKKVPRSEEPQVAELKNGLLIPAGEKYYYKLTITLVNSETIDQTEDLKASFISGFIIEEGTKSPLDTIGSEVTIGIEHFYVIGTDPNGNVNLLSKYNLDINGGSYIYNGTGLQDENVKGCNWSNEINDCATNYGAIGFSSTNYWKPLSSYTNSMFTKMITTTSYKYVYNSSSYLYDYVENYVNALNTTYSIDATGRLLSYDEVASLAGVTEVNSYISSNYSWIFNTSFWLGSANNDSNIWGVVIDGRFASTAYNINNGFGVRPVITVSKSLFD